MVANVFYDKKGQVKKLHLQNHLSDFHGPEGEYHCNVFEADALLESGR